jgi:mono/diheme cytochrome c family protein
VPEQSGVGFVPVSMERHCADCHRLEFEPDVTSRQVPHGSVKNVLLMLREFYASAALGTTPLEITTVDGLLRRPGMHPMDVRQQEAAQWADEKARRVATDLFEVRVCVVCHEVSRTGESLPGEAASALTSTMKPGMQATMASDLDTRRVTTPEVSHEGSHRATQEASLDAAPEPDLQKLIAVPWKIAPVYLTQRWLPKARFEHAKHAAVDCVQCHPVTQSKTSADVSMPTIAKCRECHVGNTPERNKISSNCELCHGFHQHDLPNSGDGLAGATRAAMAAGATPRTALSGSDSLAERIQTVPSAATPGERTRNRPTPSTPEKLP